MSMWFTCKKCGKNKLRLGRDNPDTCLMCGGNWYTGREEEK